jgi:hypothetical protein
MQKYRVKLGDFNTSKIGLNTINIATGVNIHDLIVHVEGVTAIADVPKVRLIANGDIIHEFTGVYRDNMNQYHGWKSFLDTSMLVIPFQQEAYTRWAREQSVLVTGEHGPAFKAGLVIKSLALEVEIGGATTPTKMELFTNKSILKDCDNPTIGNILQRTKKREFNAAGAGTFQIHDLERTGLSHVTLNRIYFDSSKVTRVRILRDETVIYDRTKTMADMEQYNVDKVPIANVFLLDNILDGQTDYDMALQGSNSFVIEVTVDGAGSVPYYVEYNGIGVVENPYTGLAA